MDEKGIKKILEKQLELLSKQSENCEPNELSNLTHALLDVSIYLNNAMNQ